jgi:16S rRNA (cytidine1402-2'-O)-methyltransferase
MAVRRLEERSKNEGQTQIFMEAPYRNQDLFTTLLDECHPQTRLCLATDITLETETIRTQTIREWRGDVPIIHKRPTIFLIMRE